MKFCPKCSVDKETSGFSKSSRSKDGLQAWCKNCVKDYERERYQNGDSVRKKRNIQAQRDRSHRYVEEILRQSFCLKCGIDNWVVLEFDHIDPATKEFNVSDMYRSYSLDRIKQEIAKCQVLCANCHRIRTFDQNGSWRSDV